MELPRDCADPAAMQALGRELGERLGAGGVVALDGELGAGKTELVKGLAAELGFQSLQLDQQGFRSFSQQRFNGYSSVYKIR